MIDKAKPHCPRCLSVDIFTDSAEVPPNACNCDPGRRFTAATTLPALSAQPGTDGLYLCTADRDVAGPFETSADASAGRVRILLSLRDLGNAQVRLALVTDRAERDAKLGLSALKSGSMLVAAWLFKAATEGCDTISSGDAAAMGAAAVSAAMIRDSLGIR
jgi:hypothetical protein